VGDERRAVTTIVGRDYSTIDLTAKRVANRLNAKSKLRTPGNVVSPTAATPPASATIFCFTSSLTLD